MENLRMLFDELADVFGVSLWDGELATSQDDGGAQIWVDVPYRRYRITVMAGFCAQEPLDQAKTILHEFCHFFNVPVKDLAEDLREGKLVTHQHLTDIMEYCNTRAEQVLYQVANSQKLKNAIERYTKAGGFDGKGKRNIKGKKRDTGRR